MSRPKLLTTTETADLLGIPLRSFRALQRQHRTPPAINVGTQRRPVYRFDPADIDRWIAARKTKAA